MHKTFYWNNSELYIHNVIRSQQPNNCGKQWEFFFRFLWKLVTRITALWIIPCLARSVDTIVWSVLLEISINPAGLNRAFGAMASLVIQWFCFNHPQCPPEKKCIPLSSELTTSQMWRRAGGLEEKWLYKIGYCTNPPIGAIERTCLSNTLNLLFFGRIWFHYHDY